MDIKVSIIIPVHNMAEWISQSIDIVEKQTLKEKEIICVDDGSTDDTVQILEKYREKYKNLSVIRQQCKGPGSARNHGMLFAKGEYIAFLDADDYYYADDSLEYLYKKAVDNHAMICRGSSCDDRKGVLSFDGLRPERVFKEDGFISKTDIPGPTGFWAGIYNREFLNTQNIVFPDLRMGEDGVFSVSSIAKAGKVYCLKRVVYVYRKEHKTVLYTEEMAVDAVRAVYDIMTIADKNGMERLFNSWKNAFYGQTGALMYKYAAIGNAEMLDLIKKTNKLLGGNLHEGDEIRAYVDQVKKGESSFLSSLKAKEAVYVFGAGTVGIKVVSYLLENDITPDAIIVSNIEQNPEMVSGIPVRSIESIDRSQDYEIVIATYWYTQDAIKTKLGEHGLRNVYSIDLCEFQLWQDAIRH